MMLLSVDAKSIRVLNLPPVNLNACNEFERSRLMNLNLNVEITLKLGN